MTSHRGRCQRDPWVGLPMSPASEHSRGSPLSLCHLVPLSIQRHFPVLSPLAQEPVFAPPQTAFIHFAQPALKLASERVQVQERNPASSPCELQWSGPVPTVYTYGGHAPFATETIGDHGARSLAVLEPLPGREPASAALGPCATSS